MIATFGQLEEESQANLKKVVESFLPKVRKFCALLWVRAWKAW